MKIAVSYLDQPTAVDVHFETVAEKAHRIIEKACAAERPF